MNISYFLGANSRSGFYSLYDSFPPGEAAFLHIIKGGPGNGKSRFMRRIGAAAESRGLDVEYVLCSGDPDSLDGVYIPALGAAWCDGTAPHVTEPRIFAVTADYVNLGSFCRLPLSAEDARRISLLNREYKALYAKAYKYLSAAAQIRDSERATELSPELLSRLSRRLGRILDATPSMSSGSGPSLSRFFSAISCKGQLCLKESVSRLCSRVFALPAAIVPAFMALAAKEAESRGLSPVLCPEALDPSGLEALLLPGSSLAFVPESWGVSGQQLMDLDGMELPAPAAVPELYAPAMSRAILLLSQAKSLHDQLEAVYKPYMDFKSLDVFTRSHIDLNIDKALSQAGAKP